LKPHLERVIAWIGLAAALVLFTWFATWTWDSVVDDSYISARYAAQFAAGNGMVYNAGEPPVEGVTNLSWTFLLAQGLRAGVPAMYLMPWMGYVFGALAIVLTFLLTVRLSERVTALSFVPAMVVALSPHFAVSATNGLESSMMVFAVLLAIWTHFTFEDGRRWIAGLAVGLLIWTRPEGIAVALGLVVHDVYQHRHNLKRALPYAGYVVGFQLLLSAWRWFTYGDVVPNTFHAKSSFPIWKTFSVNGPYLNPEKELLLTGVALLLLGSAFSGMRHRAWIMGALGAGLAFIPLPVNLWMPGIRLFLSALTVALILFWTQLSRGAAWRGVLLALGLIGAMSWFSYDQGNRIRRYDWRHTVVPNNGTQQIAEHFATYAPEGEVLATRDAGVFAYYVGIHHPMAELHQRALTKRHPNGDNANWKEYTPENPGMFASTIRRAPDTEMIYNYDKGAFKRMTEPYVYLGRVQQHYHRFYDVYVRADIELPPLPSKIIVNYNGPRPQNDATPEPPSATQVEDLGPPKIPKGPPR